MIDELLALYEEYCKDLDEWNKTKRPPLEDEQEPQFSTFMTWLWIRRDMEKSKSM